MIKRSPYERNRSPVQALESGRAKRVRPAKKLVTGRKSDNSVFHGRADRYRPKSIRRYRLSKDDQEVVRAREQ